MATVSRMAAAASALALCSGSTSDAKGSLGGGVATGGGVTTIFGVCPLFRSVGSCWAPLLCPLILGSRSGPFSLVFYRVSGWPWACAGSPEPLPGPRVGPSSGRLVVTQTLF